MDLEAVVDELYGLPAADFTTRRDALVAEARAVKDAGLAKQVRELRKPTASAALVNRLAREAADVLEDYLALGERLRAAQARLAGDQMRALGQERQRAAAALLKRAVALGGGQVSASVQQEVDATLTAAVADPAAAQAVASGRLTRGLSYAGLGEVDITAATATPLTARPRPAPEPATTPAETPEPPHSAPGEPQEPEPSRAARRPARGDGPAVLAERRERADAELDQAQADVQAAREAAELAAAEAREAVATQRDAEAEVDDLRERLAQARFAVRQAQQEVASAQAARQQAERAVTAAEKAYGKARHRRDLLGED